MSYVEPKTEPDDVYLGSEPARRDAMTEQTVTITMSRRDAEEVAHAVRIAAHYQLSGTDALAKRTTEAIESALYDEPHADAPAPPACPVCNGLRRIPSGATYMDHIEYVACPDCVIAKAPDRAAVDAALNAYALAVKESMAMNYLVDSDAQACMTARQKKRDTRQALLALILPDGGVE